MTCPKCNHEIPEGGSFCPQCGYRMDEEKSPEQAAWTEPEKKNDKKLLIGVIIGAGVLICALVAVIAVLLIGRKSNDAEVEKPSESQIAAEPKSESEPGPEEDGVDLTEAYAEAKGLLEKGEYAQAQEMLAKLGEYEDAQTMASYAAARLLLEEGKLADAKAAFEALGEYRDASELAKQCQDELTYQEAVAKKTAGEYAAAAELFAQIPGVKDADEQAADCRTQAANASIAAAIAKEDWEGALALLDGEDGRSYPDYDNVRKTCLGHANYDKAKQFMEEKHYYKAYKLFTEMGDFLDAENLASLCKRPFPSTGEMFRNANYSVKSTFLKPYNNLGGYSLYFRLYDYATGARVLSCFVKPKENLIVYIPDGTYTLKVAYGYGPWYGEEDMFGDDGIYKDLGMKQWSAIGRGWGWKLPFDDVLEGTTITWEEF